MVGFGSCPCSRSIAGLSFHTTILILIATPSRRLGSHGLECRSSDPERQKQLVRTLFASLTDWCDDKWNERSSLHPDFRHRRKRSLHSQYENMQVDSRLGTSDAQLRNGPDGALDLGPARSGDGLQRLCEQGQLDKALDVLVRMDTIPTVSMYSSLLRACVRKKALGHAKRVQSHMAEHGLDSTRFLGEYMVSTLVKCGGLEDAFELFRKLPQRTVFSWTALVTGYTAAGKSREAVRMYHSMREEGLEPNRYTFCGLLRACGNLLDLEEGKRIHAEAVKYNCESDLYVNTCLVDMYSKCGSIVDAQNVFNGLSQPDVVSWNAMLAAYVEQGQAGKALQLYQKMCERGASPNDRTYVCALQACRLLGEKKENFVDGQCMIVKPLDKGKELHNHAQKKGYDSDVFVGSMLISMYGKCGSTVDALNVFDGLSHRNVVTWNSMLAAYAQHGQAEEALQLREQMSREGVSPDDRTFVSLLQACGMVADKEQEVIVDGRSYKVKSLKMGTAIHADARFRGYDSDIFVGNTLVSMYGKCGCVVGAQSVFDGLSKKSVVSWTALLAAYAQQGEAAKVLQLYKQMQVEGVSPNSRTLVIAFQACGMLADKENGVVDVQSRKLESLELCRAIHLEARRKGHDAGVFVGNTVISMYGKCGSIVDAEQVFYAMSQRDVVSWTVMLSSYVQQGEAKKALQLYEQMQKEGISPDERTIVSALQACGMLAEKEDEVQVNGQLMRVRSLAKGRLIHCDARRKGYHSDIFVGSTLVSIYGKCGSIVEARQAFDELSQRNVVSWNAMLAACVQLGEADKAFQLYEQMQEEGEDPDVRTFVRLLQACGLLAEKEEDVVVDGRSTKAKSLEKGRALHDEARKKGYDSDLFVGSTLISMYGKCGNIVEAEKVFDGLSQRNVVSWTAMLMMYIEQGQAEKALQLYEQMQERGVNPNDRTFVGALQACGMLAGREDGVGDGQNTKSKALEKGKAIHADAGRLGYCANEFVASSLISMYGKCGSIVDARNVFDSLSHKDVVSWTVMLAVYAHQGQAEVAYHLYEQMKEEGVVPDEITLVCILQACSTSGGLHMCRQIHRNIVSTKSHLSLLLGTTLIHAYGNCASMVDAREVFDALIHLDAVTWNALIAGYAREGNSAESLQCYKEMQLAGTKPDGITFLALLCACSHAGLVNKGVEYFQSMTRDHSITPDIVHYVSMVDLLGRAGFFTMVEHLLSTMPMEPDLAMWLCLLGACRKHGKVALGKHAFDRAVHLQPGHSSTYVLMSSIYADASLWDEANEVNALEQKSGAWKKLPGQSWTEHEQEVHTFMVGDRKHPQQEHLYDTLEQMSSELKKGGHIPLH